MPGTLSDLQRVNVAVSQRFRQNQPAGPDVARLAAPQNFRDEVLKGGPDLLVAAVLSSLVDEGWEPRNLWVVAVSTGPGLHPNHVVGLAQDDHGRRFVVGDAAIRDAYPARSAPYRPVSYRRLDHPDLLFRAAPDASLARLFEDVPRRTGWLAKLKARFRGGLSHA